MNTPQTQSVSRAVAALVALAIAGCVGSPAVESKKDAAEVTVVHPKKQPLRRVVEQPGTIQAYEEANLFGRVPGFVKKVTADIGQSVRGPKLDAEGREVEPGQVLAEISVPELDEELAQKKALVLQGKSEVELAKKSLASADATIAAAEAGGVEAAALNARWQSELKRITGLVAGGVIDAQTRDETTNQARAAEARVQSASAALRKAKADRDKSAADVATAEARVLVAEADARRVAALQSFSMIRAPFGGIVTRRKINVGDFIAPAGNGDALFSVARVDPVRVVLSIPEMDAEFIRDKAEAKLTIPALAKPHLQAAITRTSWALEPGSRTLRAEIDLPNPDGMLRPGMYLSAQIVAVIPDVWTVPSSALVRQGDATVCYLIDGSDKAMRTVVRTGRSDGTSTEVVGRRNAAAMVPWDGTERVASKAVGLSDGQTVDVR